jgi:hypothetical protein
MDGRGTHGRAKAKGGPGSCGDVSRCVCVVCGVFVCFVFCQLRPITIILDISAVNNKADSVKII